MVDPHNSIGVTHMNKATYFFKKHLPDILTGVSIVGVGLTAYMAHKDTLREKEIFNFERPETGVQKALCYVETYWRTGLTAAGTMAAIIFCRKVTAEQLAAMVATCAAVEQRFNAYREIVRKEFGKEKERDIYIETAQSLDPDWGITPPLPEKADDYDDSYVFYDAFSNRYFVSSVEKVQQAMYHINRNFAMRGYACANEYYNMLGLDGIPNGDNIGWESVDLMESGLAPWIGFESELKIWDDGTKYYILYFEVDPSVEAMEAAMG